MLGCLVLLVFIVGVTRNSPLSHHQRNSEHHFPLSPTLLELEVVAILSSPSRRALGLSRTLSHTLNSVTAADLVSQLDFPDKNVTWRVSNFFVSSGDMYTLKKERLILHNRDIHSFDRDSPFDETSDDDEDDEEDEDEYLGDDATSLGNNSSRKGRHRPPFGPACLQDLCEFVGKGRAVAIVSLLPQSNERLLSLVSNSIQVPLIVHSSVPTLKDEEELYINLWSGDHDLARGVVHLLIHCHWHSFAVLFDDSPTIRATQSMWKKQLSSKVKVRLNDNHWNGSDSEYLDYLTEHEMEGDDFDHWSLRPHYITIQSRFSNSPFRALSEVTKATQGVIVLILSQRSTMAVFQAAKKLQMFNGDYIFILVDSHAQFEKISDWLPHGVGTLLALRSPRRPLLSKKKIQDTGELLASSFNSLKDQPLLSQYQHNRHKTSSNSATFPSSSSSKPGQKQMVGGTFSGFTNRDFEVEGQLDFVGEKKEESHENTGGDLFDKHQETFIDTVEKLPNPSCFQHLPSPSSSRGQTNNPRQSVSSTFSREIRRLKVLKESEPDEDHEPPIIFDIMNLIRSSSSGEKKSAPTWTRVGTVSPKDGKVSLNTIRWPGGGIFGPGDNERPTKAYRVVTVVAPPFVMESQGEGNKTCVRGLPCLKVSSQNKDDLAVAFAKFESRRGNGDYNLACCDGLAMDLLASVARELKLEIDLFLVPDGYYGSKREVGGKWNGLMGALVSGAAHLCFAPFSVTSVRATAVDFSTPFFFSGVGLLGISKERDVPLLAFLAPFSPTLWAAIFITLNLTALVVAIYEWFSPFGLNPWGRQRTKNFSISSALWVVWGRLFSHLVAFKAPKSWPNKFLINVWGGFSVIFVASYTANIAALFAGMFFERHVDVNDRSLLSQRVTAIKHSATDFYIKRENPHLWEHIQRFPVHSFQEGVQMLKNGSLDLLIGDGPLLDYYRGSDSSCSLIDVSDHDKIGDDSYAIAMIKGFPLKDSVSGLIAKYLGNGYMDYLQGKWYGQMPCFSKSQQQGARALGVDAVVGMLIMLGVAFALGIVILILELVIFKHALPFWRAQPKGTLWRSPNLMFFSQKLYRFINCVELVSPHHAAKELAKTLRQGQITSLFQKSVKRKEHEQRRRRKSKAQFYEMIQEIKRVQMAERQGTGSKTSRGDDDSGSSAVYSIQGRLEKDLYMPPRLSHAPGGEEILIADYPTAVGLQGGQSSLDDPPSTSASDNTATRRIQWRRPGQVYTHSEHVNISAISSVSPLPPPKPQGILRRGGRLEVAPAELGVVVVDSNKTPAPPTDETDDEEGEVSDDDQDSYELYSPLDKADLKGLSKGQIIEMWRASELDLRRQLSQALKARDELSVALSRAETPAMLVEFDQVQL